MIASSRTSGEESCSWADVHVDVHLVVNIGVVANANETAAADALARLQERSPWSRRRFGRLHRAVFDPVEFRLRQIVRHESILQATRHTTGGI